MSRNNLLQADTKTFNEIIGNGKIYKVPDFQRDYSWQLEQWEDLWEDILDVINENSVHYMGTVVFQNTLINQKEYVVIDGQQRLATLSLLAIACIKLLQEYTSNLAEGTKKEENLERIRINRRKFLGEKDPVALHYSSKLKLNENNNFFYQSKLIQLAKPHNLSTLTHSEKLLWNAQEFFYDKAKTYFSDHFEGQEIAIFLNTIIAEKLIFMEIIVEDDLSAYTVFETINSRGIELTATDLLKNYLFSLVSEGGKTDISLAKEKWKRMIDIIGLKLFPSFLKDYLNSKQRFVSREKLFKIIKPIIKTGEDVFNLLDELESYAKLYAVLEMPNDSYWLNNKVAQSYIYILNIFNIKESKSLLLAANEHFSTNEFNRLLRHCVIISFRYTVISSLNPKEMERVYNKVAILIREGKIKTARDFFIEVSPSLYVNDSIFKMNFSYKKINSRSDKQLIKYIFIELENYIAKQNYAYISEPSTLEHIMPESYSVQSNEKISEANHQDYVYKLGNYTLLEENLNRECANKSFEIKREIYQKSKYQITKELKNKYLEWTESHIVDYQEHLAKLAVQIWRIDV